jgi:hypothetical protein
MSARFRGFMVSKSRRCALAFLALVLLAVPAPARAQSIGFVGGGTIDPHQGYGGVFWESPDLGGGFRIRPGIDGGMGNGLWLVSINIDLLAKFPLGQSQWSLLQGGGPTIVIATLNDVTDSPKEVHAGGSYIFGFAHKQGFFAEFRIGGGGYVPNLKMGAGWSIALK